MSNAAKTEQTRWRALSARLAVEALLALAWRNMAGAIAIVVGRSTGAECLWHFETLVNGVTLRTVGV